MQTRPPVVAAPIAAGDHNEPHKHDLAARLNWLRAGVLGANDGIVSTAGVVMGVAGATTELSAILTAGVAAMVAGALSMAGGEYVSVSTQRDTEQAALTRERWELTNLPEVELAELQQIYENRGLSPELAARVAQELTANDALAAHAQAELGFDPEALTNPWSAALASFVAFAIGASLPLLTIFLPLTEHRLAVTVGAVVIGLAITGGLSAHLGGAPRLPAVIRNIAVGALTMGITYLVGRLFGVAMS